MKKLLLAVVTALTAVSFMGLPFDVEAKRLGGGKPAGMQRQMPAQPSKPADATPNAPTPAPTNAAAPAAVPAAAAAAGKRSWLGPIAGIAAGLGIAALFSHFGMGEGLGNVMTMALMAIALFFVVRWVMGRFAGGSQKGPQFAGAGAGGSAGMNNAGWNNGPSATPMQRSSLQGMQTDASLATTSPGLLSLTPESFDAPAFERVAKMMFIRMQAANDAGNVEDLRRFTTPELFASLRLDVQERGNASQQTDVVQLDAKVVDTARESNQWVASVRFQGLIRETAGGTAEPFDELWHLVKPVDDSREWAIAGITPQG